jgi:hypothetical protein
MEDDLNLVENGRRPQFFSKWKKTYFYIFFLKKKMTSIYLRMEDNLKINKYIYNQLHSTAHTSRQRDQQNKLK